MAHWIKPNINIDFVGRSRTFATVSVIAVVASLGALGVNWLIRGQMLNWGTEFKGGTQIEVQFAKAMAPNDVRAVLARYWGLDAFLPLQREAMASVLAGRDSLVVLPTGGGKSLCFQAPALLMQGMGVLVSPLISLMKDHVDSLCASSGTYVRARVQTASILRLARARTCLRKPGTYDVPSHPSNRPSRTLHSPHPPKDAAIDATLLA